MLHEIRKFGSTLRICWCVMLARTFGRYDHSGWDGYDEYAQYEWRGKISRIPMFEPRRMSEDELLAALQRDFPR